MQQSSTHENVEYNINGTYTMFFARVGGAGGRGRGGGVGAIDTYIGLLQLPSWATYG